MQRARRVERSRGSWVTNSTGNRSADWAMHAAERCRFSVSSPVKGSSSASASAGASSARASGTLEKFKQTLNNLIEALAILLVTSCLIPILVILLFLWLFKLIIGIDIPLPALKAEKRNTEQTNQEQ